MYKTHIYLYLYTIFCLRIYDVNSESICVKCFCDYIKTNEDVQGEKIHCSYVPELFKGNYSVPKTVISLDLSSNNLTSVNKTNIFQSKTMTVLDLSHNLIVEIEENVFELPALKILDISDNLLEIIPEGTFSSLKNLEYLNLANNKFVSFTSLQFHKLSNLKEIILDNNNIGKSLKEINIFDRNGFGLTHKIQNISISGINLNNVPDNFFVDAYDIRKIIISNNNISEIFEIPFTLEYLDISDNPLSEINMEDFNDVPALKELKLNNLLIDEVPEYVFSSLKALVSLELERNKRLTKFSKLAFGQEILEDPDDFVLEKLSLRGSNLTKLDEQLLEPLGQLVKLDLQGNPWRCDCKLLWIRKLQIQLKDLEYLRCATPKHLYDRRIFDIDNKYFKCPQLTLQPKHLKSLAPTIGAIAFCLILAFIALWFFIFLPKYQSRGNCIQSMYSPTAAYSVLPLSLD